MFTFLSVFFALSAAALYGVSSVLQQSAAQKEKELPIVGLKIVRRLIRRPFWLFALSLSGLSFIVQAIALKFGPLALVQPIAATDLLFALPLLAYRHRYHINLREWLACAMVVGGITGFLVISPPSSGLEQPSLAAWTLVFVCTGITVTIATIRSFGTSGTQRTMLLAGAGSLLFAVVDALTKGLVDLTSKQGVAALTSWEPYVLLVAGICGIVFAQAAYRSGSLVTSLPIIDTVEPIAAVFIGATVFNEKLGGSLLLWSTQIISASIAVLGIVLLSRAPYLSTTS